MFFFDGLYFYEIVLLVFGALLFVVLIFVLLYSITHEKAVGGLVRLFGIAVLMIGYPSLQQIQFHDGMLTITKYTADIQANPTDLKARELLQQSVSKWADRAASDLVHVKTLTTLASAQYALGNEPAARSSLQKALQAGPTEPSAIALRTKIDAVQNLNELTARVKADPSNQAATAALSRSLQSATETPIANPIALLRIGQAQEALGQKRDAQSSLQKALLIKPDLAALR